MYLILSNVGHVGTNRDLHEPVFAHIGNFALIIFFLFSDGLIALNKPYGIGMKKTDKSKATEPQTTVETLNMGITPPHTPAMSQVLPLLQEQYAANHLEIVKSTERLEPLLIPFPLVCPEHQNFQEQYHATMSCVNYMDLHLFY